MGRGNLIGRHDTPPQIIARLREARHKTVGLIGANTTKVGAYVHRVVQCQHALTVNDEPCLRDDCDGCARELYDSTWDESRRFAKQLYRDGWTSRSHGFPEPRFNFNSQLVLRVDRLKKPHQEAIARELNSYQTWSGFTYTVFTAPTLDGVCDALYEALAPYWVKISPPTRTDMVEFLDRRLRFDGIEGVTSESLMALGNALEWDVRRVDRVAMRLHMLGFTALSDQAIDSFWRSRPRANKATPAALQ